MSEINPDPLTEAFRHGNNNAQTVVTGAARMIEQRLLRADRERRYQADQQRQLAEQARDEAAKTKAAQVAALHRQQAVQDQADLDTPETETDPSEPVNDAYPDGPTAAADHATDPPSPPPTTDPPSDRSYGPTVPFEPTQPPGLELN